MIRHVVCVFVCAYVYVCVCLSLWLICVSVCACGLSVCCSSSSSYLVPFASRLAYLFAFLMLLSFIATRQKCCQPPKPPTCLTHIHIQTHATMGGGKVSTAFENDHWIFQFHTKAPFKAESDWACLICTIVTLGLGNKERYRYGHEIIDILYSCYMDSSINNTSSQLHR